MKSGFVRNASALFCASLSLGLAGCLSGGGDSSEASSGNPPGSTNRAPTITGNPPPAIVVGQAYAFTPTASDPDGDPLTFSIQNRPSWAGFDTATGALTGTPAAGTEGTYANIRISVSDGSLSTSMSQFAIEVTQSALGSATLSWTAPTQNTDGTPLMDLAAYRIYYGTSPGTYSNQVYIDNPGTTMYVIDGLAPNTYYFVGTSINMAGTESVFSNMASKVVN